MNGIAISLGPLGATLVREAAWAGRDAYPAWPEYGAELEVLLQFLQRHNQLPRFWPRLTTPRTHERDETLQEIRVAHYLHDRGFPIIAWEPLGAGGRKGEFSIQASESLPIFVEVKAPGWEGELSNAARVAGRQRQEKYRDVVEGGAVAPWRGIRQTIKKAYPKFLPSQPNLLVIADDYFVSLNEWGDLAAGQALYLDNPILDGERGYFCTSEYQNLGGVALFSATLYGSGLEYQLTLHRNPKALPATGLLASVDSATRSVNYRS